MNYTIAMSKANPKTLKETYGDADNISSSCKFRAYVNEQQFNTIGHYLYWVQKFRNQCVEFCQDRRKARAVWLHKHPVLVRLWKACEMDADKDSISLLPEEIAGNDVSAASRWLTQRLEAARYQLETSDFWYLLDGGKDRRAVIFNAWVNMSDEQKADIPDAWLLTLPRTILDQCLQDMSKTYVKALKDRKSQVRNPAGFPQFQKHSYPYSVRFQISTKQNKTYVEAWNTAYAEQRKEIYIPSLGVVKFRDKQNVPAIPPEMITISRNSSGQFHMTFVNKDPASRVNTKFTSMHDAVLPCEEMYDPIAKSVVMVPTSRGGDVGLKVLCTYSQALAAQQKDKQKKEAERKRYLKHQEQRLAWANKSLSRKTKGSKRWLKAKIKQGKVHTKTTNCRDDYLKKEAQIFVKATAIACLEDLNLRFMLQNRNLSKSAADASLGKFKQYVLWEAQKMGHLVLQCNRFDATSKTCHACKSYYKDLTLKERTWVCSGCGTTLDRDENAAINIRVMALQKAITLLASGSGATKMLSPYPLHRDLTSFIERGGLTSLLMLNCISESQVGENPSCPVKRLSHQHSVTA